MSNEKNRYSYESPNIVIVPTVSFIDGPPAKKIKLDDVSEKTRTTNNINKTFKGNNSWASNYLHSIGQSQLASSSNPKIQYMCHPDKNTNLEDRKENNLGNPLPENGKPSEIITSSVMHTPNISRTTLEVTGPKENVNVLQQNPPKSTSPISWFFGSLQTNSDLKKCTSDIGDNNKHTSVAKTQIIEKGTKENTSVLQQNPPKPTSPISWFFGSNHTNSAFTKCTSDIGDNYKHTSVAQKQINEKSTQENKSFLQQNPPKPTSPISWFFGSNLTNSAFTKCTSDIGDKHTSVAQKQINEKDNNKFNLKTPKSHLHIAKDPVILSSETHNDKIGRNLIQKHNKAHDNYCLKSKLNYENENKYKFIKDSEKEKNRRHDIYKQKIRNEVHTNKFELNTFHDDRTKQGTKVAKKTLTKNGSCSGEKNPNIQEIDNRVKSLLSSVLPVETNRKLAAIQVNLLKKQSKDKATKILNKIQNVECITDSRIINSAENSKCEDKHEKNLVNTHENRKGEISRKPTHLDVNTLKKKRLIKPSHVNQSQDKNKREKQRVQYDSPIISSAENSKSEDKHEKKLVNTHENRKGEISRKPIHLDVNTLKKKRLIKPSHVNQTQDKNKREKQYVQTAISGISKSKVKRGKDPFKHKRLHKDSKKGCDIKEDVKTEVTKVMNTGHENYSGKILMKKNIVKSLKSVVQLADNFEFEIPSKTYAEAPLIVEDLRKKLNRGKKYRDNLIVSVPNDVTFEQENKIKEELPKNKSIEPKVTTIKLVINLISGKTKDKSIEEEPRSNETNERELASIDLSFLDDFNVDDIVDSLNYDVNTCNLIKEDNKKQINTDIETTYEAPDTNHLKNNEPHWDIKLGTTSENKTQLAQDGINDEVHVHKVKQEETSSEREREIVIKTELIPMDEASITEKTITSNKPIICNTSREIAISENKESLSSVSYISKQKTVTVSNSIANNLIEPKTVAIKKETENSDTEHPAERNNTVNFAKESRTNLESDAIQDLTKPKQENGINMQHMHTNIVNQSNVYNLVKSCTASTVTSKNSKHTSTSTIDLTDRQQTNEASISGMEITCNKPLSCNTSKKTNISKNKESVPYITNIPGQEVVTLTNSIASQLIDPSTVAIKTETEIAVFYSLFSQSLVEESEAELEKDYLKDLSKPKIETNINMQLLNKNITDERTDDNLLESCPNTIDTSKNSENTSTSIIDLTEPDQNMRQVNNGIINKKMADHVSIACSYIDLTEPELNISPKEHPSDTDITCSADTSTKPANSIIDTSETCDDILIIDLTESEKNIEPITQQLVTDLNNIISANMEISRTNCLPINVTEIENESGLKIQNSCKDKVDPECNSIITEQNKAIRTSSLKTAMQVSDSNESNTNHLAVSKNEPKATDANSTRTGVKSQDNSSIVKHSSQVIKESTEFRQGISVTMPLGLRKTEFEEFLSESLKERMLIYLHINYDIGMLIRRGKYSRIFHCTDQKKNEYAIKILHSKQDRYELGIKKENMILDMQKDIPKEKQHFVHLISGFGMQGRWCFLMEYYPMNLRQVLNDRERCFHINDVQRLSRQLVSAVIMLRHNNIIHSDIKPEHILLNSSLDTLKLCGFDECRKVDQVILLPNIGTPSYRAPEIILGYSDGFSIDVWSTALVMFEMAAAYRLFPGVYNNDILYKQMSILGPIPLEMVLSSIFKDHHFFGNQTQVTFKRKVGVNGKDIVQIRHFERVGIRSHIYKAHQKFFKNTSIKDKARSFCDLLHEMLVMDPQKRIPIEFVYANPFLYEYCLGNLF